MTIRKAEAFFIFHVAFFIFHFVSEGKCVSQPNSQTPHAELVYQETNIVVKNGVLTKSLSYEIRINDRLGEEFNKIQLPYSRMNKISKVEGCIKDKEGRIVKKLEKDDITDKSSMADFSFYEDNFVKEFTLKHNSYPYSILYSYQLQQTEFFYIDDWLPVINPEVPTLEAVLNVEVPEGYKILFSEQNVDSPKRYAVDLQVHYTWQTTFVNTTEAELYAPPLISFMPRVTIVPLNFHYHADGSCQSWTTFGNWQDELLKDQDDLPSDIRDTVLTLVRGVKDPKEQVRILYHYLQNETRYINITIETGGLKPYPASYVARNKFGDCKALTNYFKTLLDAAGIKSNYTIVNAGSPALKINKDFPSQQFNHVILNVPIGDDTIWLDCTSDKAFNYLGTFTQNRNVFVIDRDKSYFARTPALTEADVLVSRTFEITPGQQNEASVIFTGVYRGQMYEYLFGIAHSMNESDQSALIRDNFIGNRFELISYELHDPDPDLPKISLSCSARSGKIFQAYGNEVMVSLIPFGLPSFEKPKNRKMPVQLDFPICKADTLVYNIPSGYVLADSLPNSSIINEFGRYNRQFIQSGTKVIVIKNLTINAGSYPLEKYQEFYNFISRIDETETISFILTRQN